MRQVILNDSFKNIIDEKTGLVALSHALFNTGAILPVEEIGKILQKKIYHILLMQHKQLDVLEM